ncbi:MAG: iron-sulfur cluster assembly accessory protein, partial [Acidobacteria bacterium ACB2]|nr:iron-sulfur cluster assembly accessory protein [Acidobacteria bacterium ACB2]
MRPEDSVRESDLVWVVEEGLTLVCDPKSAPILQGTVIEYTGNLIGGG